MLTLLTQSLVEKTFKTFKVSVTRLVRIVHYIGSWDNDIFSFTLYPTITKNFNIKKGTCSAANVVIILIYM